MCVSNLLHDTPTAKDTFFSFSRKENILVHVLKAVYDNMFMFLLNATRNSMYEEVCIPSRRAVHGGVKILIGNICVLPSCVREKFEFLI